MNAKLRSISCSILLALGLAFTPARPVHAATCTVTSDADSGTGSLREKLADSTCDTITFGGDYSIRLASTLIIDRDVIIDGVGHSVVISGDANGNNTNDTGDVRVFEVSLHKTFTLQNLTVTLGYSEADGGAIHNSGTVVADYVTFSNNFAGVNGGAILNFGGEFPDLDVPCTNTAACNEGNVTVTNSTFIDNYSWRGGAIYNYGGRVTNGGNMTVTNSTFSDNHAQYGGAIKNRGSIGAFDGIFGTIIRGHGGNLTVTNSTFAGSTGWNGANIQAEYPQNLNEDHNGTITLNNNIFVRGGSQYDNCWITDGRSFYGSNNLADDSTCSVAAYSDSIRLGPLGSYGGSTQTIPLLPGSAAIETGYNATCPATDQRGVARPQGANCDAGAYESRGFTLTRTGGDQQSTPVNLAFAQPLQVSLQETGGSGLPGLTVTFTGPGAGASTSPQSFTAVTDSSGQAAATAMANGTPGAYTVSASIPYVAGSVGFSLANQQAATTTSLAAAPNPSNFGQAVTLTAMVTSPSGTPTGVVTFKDGGTAISGCGAVGLSGGQAACTLTTLAAGSHALSAVYGGDSAYTGSTSDTVTQVVVSASITVTSSADSGSGTLRQAIADLSPGGLITFSGDMTMRLASPLILDRDLTIDGGDHKVVISGDSNNDGSGDVRVFSVNAGVTAALKHLTVTRGYASDSGGGIYINDGASLTLSDSALTNNAAVIYGGAILNYGTLAVTGTTLSGNSAYRGGGIYNSGTTLTATNVTFVGNSASDDGGNLYIAGGTVTSRNSIYVKGTTGNNCHIGPLGSNNLADDTSCGTAYYSTSILLGPLGDYGGPTQTYPLLPGSAAIDAGASASCPTADQRGVARVGTCDIGAFESRKFSLGSLTGTPQSARVYNDFTTPLGLTISANASGEPVNGGKVTFNAPASGASAVITGSPAAISGGKASVTAKANGLAGSYNVTASAAGAASVNFALTNTGAASTTSLASAPNPSDFEQAATFTVTVSGSYGTPTGTVAFKDGETAIIVCSSVALSNGHATCSLSSLAVGSHAITAVYGGNSTYTGSTSSPVVQTVNPAVSTTTLTSAPNPSTFGQEVTFTAMVSPASGEPTGTVTFYENLPLTIQQGSQAVEGDSSSNVVPLTDGMATFTTSALSAGTHSIIAQYSGDATYKGSTSSAVTQVVSSGSPIVTSSADSGPGTLRQALADVAPDGTITFAGDMTITLASTLTIDRNLTIDGGTNHIVISGDANGNDVGDTGDVQVLIINAGVSATLQHLTVTRGYLVSGDGGGISISSGASLTLSDSTLSNNYAGSRGGAVYNLGNLAVTKSTFSGNNAYQGGAIFNDSAAAIVTLTVTNSTFVGNSATYGGSVYDSGGGFGSTNTIYVKGASGNNCFGVLSGSNNLADDATCGTAASTTILLGQLGSYGGPTQTFPLLPGSAAIDAGASAFCPETDQRGMARVGTCDIGAFESRKFSLGSLTGAPQSAPLNTAFAAPLGLTVSANAPGEPVDGGQVTFTAPASGASAAMSGSPAAISGGNASVTAAANGTAGSYNVTASAAGASSASFLLTNTRATSTTSLSSSPNPSSYGEAVTLTATLSGSSGTPAGTVTFQDNGAAISACSSVVLSGGQATCVLTTLAAGDHPLTAQYSGDATYAGSTSSAVTQVVHSTSIVVTSSADIGRGTLRQAMADIAPGGTITFAGDMTIYLSSPLLILQNMTIDGDGHQVVISGDTGNDGTGNIFIFAEPDGVTAALRHLTLEKGYIDMAYLGGAIINHGTLAVTDSTFSGNTAVAGGAIHNYGTLTVTNSTFFDNSATYHGGAIFNETGTLTVTNSTFSGNNGPLGAFINMSTTPVIVRNNVFVKGTTGANCYGNFVGGNNLADDATCGTAASTTILLGPLGSYGGPTQTFPLLPGSAAIDAGASAFCPETDQRGMARVGTCDIGAFESQGFTLSNPTGAPQSAPLNTAFAAPLGLTITANGAGEPVDGGQVTFTAPDSGASTNPAVNVATISGGAVSQPVTANGLTGPYLVTASTRGASGTLSYALANGKALAAVNLVSSPNPSSYKQRVTFTATVSGASDTPTGTVTFYENARGDASESGSGKADAGASTESAGNVVTLTNGVATFTTSSLSVGLHSMVAVYSGNATYDTSTSNTVEQGVSKAPAILTQPASQTVVEGQQASFSADAIGYPDMSVQWQESTDGKNWANIDGANAIPLTFTASFSQNGSQYRVTFTNSLGSATSNAATLTVQQLPAITQQPQSATVNAGETVTFSAAASGSPAPTVQWQQSTDSGATWTDISGAASASYSLTASLSMNGSQYRAVFTNAAGSATSEAAILTVNEVTGTASISGLVYSDANGNGVLDRGEAGLAGWTVQLFDAGGAWIADMTTDNGGAYNYTFSNLSAGVFRVRLAQPLPAGYIQTTADPADITLANGQAVTGVNFGAVISADVKVEMTANYDAATRTIVYTITVTNDGPADAQAVVVKDALNKKYVSYVSATSTVGTCSFNKDILTCDVGTLSSGSNATITLTVNRITTRAVTNTASETASTFDIDMTDNSASVTVP